MAYTDFAENEDEHSLVYRRLIDRSIFGVMMSSQIAFDFTEVLLFAFLKNFSHITINSATIEDYSHIHTPLHQLTFHFGF